MIIASMADPRIPDRPALALLQGRRALLHSLFQFGIQNIELCPNPGLGIHLALNGEAGQSQENHSCQSARDGDEAGQTLHLAVFCVRCRNKTASSTWMVWAMRCIALMSLSDSRTALSSSTVWDCRRRAAIPSAEAIAALILGFE